MDTSVLSPNTRLVIFDLDGTLYDKRGIIGKMMMLGIGYWSLLLAERRTREAFPHARQLRYVASRLEIVVVADYPRAPYTQYRQ